MMTPLRGNLTSRLLLIFALLHSAIAYRINATIYNTDIEHVTYEPSNDFCARWTTQLFWRTCALWIKYWESQYYLNQGERWGVHQSLDHRLPSMTLTFQGSAIYLYGPPRSTLEMIPPDYKVCLYENHQIAREPICYRVDVAEAYSAVQGFDTPVAIFSKGQLQHHEHRVVISVGDPMDETESHHGIQFSHALYTIERPTPWPVEEDRWRYREVVMHDTHPLMYYWPDKPVCSWFCWTSTGWKSKTYIAEDRSAVSWHELTSQGETDRARWGVEAVIMGGAVAIYGIPRVHIENTDDLSYVCVQIDSGHCELVNVQHAYLSTEHQEESVLLWRNDALDPTRKTRITVRLTETQGSNLGVFPFKAIHYYEKQEYSSPQPPVGQVKEVVLAHDNKAIAYHPGRRCANHIGWWCTRWFDPWTWREAGPSESVFTYRSTVWSYRETEDPAVTVKFQGSAVYVYGAPKSLVKAPFASQQVCIDNACHTVDVEQAYLTAPAGCVEPVATRDCTPALSDRHGPDGNRNMTTALSPFHPELDPVLIWSMEGFNDEIPHVLRLALSPIHSKGNAEMSIARVAYNRVTYGEGKRRPETPNPPPDKSYRGPAHPPYTKKWVPKPSIPLPSHPTPAPPSPEQPHPPMPPSRSPKPLPIDAVGPGFWAPLIGVTLLAFGILFAGAFSCSLSSCLKSRSRSRKSRYCFRIRETWRLLSETMPRPYVPPAPPPSPPSPGPERDTPPPSPRPQRRHPTPPPPPPSPSNPEDQNNIGPCPGFHVPSPKPTYDETIAVDSTAHTPPATYSPSEFSSDLPVNKPRSSEVTSSGRRLDIGGDINHSSGELSGQHSFTTPTINPIQETSRSQQQPVPAPQRVTLPELGRTTSEASPPPCYTALANDTIPTPPRAIPIQTVQPAQDPSNTTVRVDNVARREPTLPLPQPAVASSTNEWETPITSQPGSQPPGRQIQANSCSPELAEWAEAQGYRIDNLMIATSQRRTPQFSIPPDQRTPRQSNMGGPSPRPTQNGPLWERTSSANRGTTSTNWRQRSQEAAVVPPNQIAAHHGSENWRRDGQSRSVQRAAGYGATNYSSHYQSRQPNGRNQGANDNYSYHGVRGDLEAYERHGGRRDRWGGRGRGTGGTQN